MRGTGGLYSIVHTTCSSCDEAWAGWVYAWIRWCFKVTVSSGIFMAFFPKDPVVFFRLQSVAKIYSLSPQLGLEPASHTSEALAERYLNSSQLILDK
jgi:hypothetical protein